MRVASHQTSRSVVDVAESKICLFIVLLDRKIHKPIERQTRDLVINMLYALYTYKNPIGLDSNCSNHSRKLQYNKIKYQIRLIKNWQNAVRSKSYYSAVHKTYYKTNS